MKNRKPKKTDDFSQFKTKIFFHTIGAVIIAVSATYFLSVFFLRGNFGNWMVWVYQRLLNIDYDSARNLYLWTFRKHMDFMFIIGIAVTFFVIFRIYLNWFTKYFIKINQGIDDICTNDTDRVSLPPKISVTEEKINTVKHNLQIQKLNMELAEQQKNDMIMYLAYDLKTPLTSVIGYLNLLRDEEQVSEELRQKYLSVSLDKAERLEDLINEFIEIAKYNSSNITLQYSRISLTRLFEMLLYEFQPMLQEKNLKCNLMIAEDIILSCDADKIQRVFDNLLKNAVIYSFEGTDIEITATAHGKNAEIIFANHGNTIPKKKLERIFEQFYRIDDSRNTRNGGAGLGLAIAKQIIELHEGTISAKSENQTIEFKVTLPITLEYERHWQ